MRKLALFRRVFLASRGIRERLTPTGMIMVTLSGFAAAFGLDTQSNLAHTVFALCACLLAIDAAGLALLRRHSPRLAAKRILPDFVTAGEPARYRLEIGNIGSKAMPPLCLIEHLRQTWPAPDSLRHHRGSVATNRFDRAVGYPAFIDMLRRLRGVETQPIPLPHLRAGQRVEIDVPLMPTARGLAVFEKLSVVMQGPLGLVATRVDVDAREASLPVLPTRQAIDLPPASNQRHWQLGGISLALRVGDAEEFRSLRDYRPGDPLRAIHWRSFARTGRPVVRENQEEFFARHALVLDTAAPYPFAPAFEAAVSMAAWLVARPRDADSLLDLMFVGDRMHRLTAGRGLGGADGLLRVLATVAPTPPDDIELLLSSLDHNAAQMSSVIAIFLAWDEARQNAVRRLLARGVRPMVLVVENQEGEPADDDPKFAGILRRIDVSVASTSQVPA